jgi:hypothetical protein
MYVSPGLPLAPGLFFTHRLKIPYSLPCPAVLIIVAIFI